MGIKFAVGISLVTVPIRFPLAYAVTLVAGAFTVSSLRVVDVGGCTKCIKGNSRVSVTGLRPILVCQIKFTEWTRDERLRQPVFLGIREDKNAREVVREKAS
jgi:hypothetical protein